MRQRLTILLLLLSSTFVMAQTDEDQIFQIVEIQPQFPGGQEGLFEFLMKETRYPKKARDAGDEGVVYVQFVVKRDGYVDLDDIEVLRGVTPELDAEAIRVVSQMPRWEPGYQKGKPVNVYFKLPFRFTLNNGKREEPKEEGDFDWERVSEAGVERTLPEDAIAYAIVDQMPRFPGGDEGLNAFLAQEVRYPTEAIESKIQGIVHVQFIVMKSGWVDTAHVSVVQSVNPLLDAEAMRLVKSFPRYEPGKDNGKPKHTSIKQSIKFYILEEQEKHGKSGVLPIKISVEIGK